ncbi:MAG: hypothetical protein ACBR18_05035 [Microcoleus sp.]
MHPLDEKLEQLVLQAQQYLPDSKERREIIEELSDTMFPSLTLKGRPPKPTDNEARHRLGGLEASCRNRYSSKLEGDFEYDWSDALQEGLIEVLTKHIDIYKKGVDNELFKAWDIFGKIELLKARQNFQDSRFIKQRNQLLSSLKRIKTKSINCQQLCNQIKKNEGDFRQVFNACYDDIQQGFPEEVEKFRIRFLQRRTKDSPYPPEKFQQLEEACKKFCEKLKSDEIDLQQAWNTFCDEVQQLYDEPRSFWKGFESYVRFRFIDIIRKRGNVVSGDAPIARQEGDTTTQKRFDKIQAKADSSLSQDVIRLIEEDPDEIFQGKHIKNFPKENFRAIAHLKFRGATLQEIGNLFNHAIETTREITEEEKKRLYAQQTISPFFTRCCNYFKPILEEYLEAEITLPQPILNEIVNDAEGRYNRRRMPDNSQISFKGIIQSRLDGVPSWTILARQLQVNVRELIYFYLDCISSFKLMTKPKTRTRNNKKNNPPIDE